MTKSKHIGDGVYEMGGHFYHRPYLPSGGRTWRAIDAPNRKQAKAALFTIKNKGLDSSLTVGEAIRNYRAANCPDKKRNVRAGDALAMEQWRCDTLSRFWGPVKCSDLTAALVDEYADWRIKHRKWGHGGRVADLDIVTLRNALRWAARRGDIRSNPFEHITVTSYRKPTVRHCRECAPRSGDELHDLAGHFFDSVKVHTQVLGWLTLITAMTGTRISEMTTLRTDAKQGEPGSITAKVLWLRRRKKGANNFFRIHPQLRQCLKAFTAWKRAQKTLKHSPWWFPGRNPSQPIKEQSLTHALQRVGDLIAGEHRTAHGLRSFYVTCRRSAGLSDAEIALETGQISGGREIVKTYGDATPIKVSWIPSGKLAWSKISPVLDQASSVSTRRKNLLKVNFAGKNGRKASVSV